MIAIAGHNIFTELGFGSGAVYSRIREGEAALSLHVGDFGLPEPFYASLIHRDEIDRRSSGLPDPLGMTALEKAMVLSAADAVSMSGIDPSSEDTLFVVSSTKGNVDLLESGPEPPTGNLAIWHSAQKLASFFENPNEPICVSNACTSGICAQIAAYRAISSGRFRNAVVVGADFLSRFVVSGFQSLKALSPERCRPFDARRKGLNLSEAVASLVLSADTSGIGIELEGGAIRNDATHISAPSRVACGQIAAIDALNCEKVNADLAFVNLHGTATLYNDSMESVALHSCGLDAVPAVSYKSIFGHTLGAAGVLETVVSSLSMLEGVVFPTAGYAENGVPFELSVSDRFRAASGSRFLKVMSGFGGVNAATSYKKIL